MVLLKLTKNELHEIRKLKFDECFVDPIDKSIKKRYKKLSEQLIFEDDDIVYIIYKNQRLRFFAEEENELKLKIIEVIGKKLL